MGRARKVKSITPDLSRFVAEIGAEREVGNWYHFTVDTKIGPLHFTPYAGECGGGWIACRFEDVESARRHFGVDRLGHRLNPYSGKWNWNEGLGQDREGVEMMVTQFSQAVRALLPERK
jgi:hypothetical protein